MDQPYKPLFPYLGGKSRVAGVVWRAIGHDTPNYVEPFFGSGAVLCLRPGGPGPVETVNDADGFVANFWRAIRADPDAVAEHADRPVNEVDLHARHIWLVHQRKPLTDRLMGDPDFYDAKTAGWWCWGMCAWIGTGWCSGRGPWTSVNGVLTRFPSNSAAPGINRKRPHIAHRGCGVNRPAAGPVGTCAEHLANLRLMVQWFADRFRYVRVCCGDWSRVVTPAVTTRHGVTGVFLDPPYAIEAGRDPDCYVVDRPGLSADVRDWCIANGNNPKLRIVLAGYEGEHDMPPSWRVIPWKTRGGYGNVSGRRNDNATRERLWLSPHCLPVSNPAPTPQETPA